VRAGPHGSAETSSGGKWVPAGWGNSDLLQSLFTPLLDGQSRRTKKRNLDRRQWTFFARSKGRIHRARQLDRVLRTGLKKT
jgi:hypothetical protein